MFNDLWMAFNHLNVAFQTAANVKLRIVRHFIYLCSLHTPFVYEICQIFYPLFRNSTTHLTLMWPLGRPVLLAHSAALRLLALKRILLCPGHFVTIVTTHTHGTHYGRN